jgi:hypothetical protein
MLLIDTNWITTYAVLAAVCSTNAQLRALFLLLSLQVDVRSCVIKSALVFHKDDGWDYKEELKYHVKGKTIQITNISQEDSELCGILHDWLKQMGGDEPDNYHSKEALGQVGVDVCCGSLRVYTCSCGSAITAQQGPWA